MNQEVDIAFVICYPFQFHVMKDVYALLKDRAEFVIDLGAYYPAKQPRELEDDIVRILKDAGARYRILRYEDYFHAAVLEKFFARYKGVVALWERGAVRLACNASKLKIQLTYGAGKELNMVRPSRGIFDCILSYGERDHALASFYTKSVIVGNPRFDPWFRGEISKEEVAAIVAKLDPSKKTVLYLPTHSDLSSIDALGDEIAKLTHSWNVIAKLHYFTPREEPERVRRMRESGAIVCGDDVDLVRLLSLPDVVLSDNSSAIFDAILADKPVLATDFLDATYLDETHKEPRAYRRGAQPALTYSGSIEQVIKKDGRVPTIVSPEELSSGLEIALADKSHYKDARAQLRSELFAYTDGKSAERAATVIVDMIAEPRSLARPILYHAIEAYKRSIQLSSFTRSRRLSEKVAAYERALGYESESTFIPSLIIFREEGVDPAIEIESVRGAVVQSIAFKDIVVIATHGQKPLELPRDFREHVRERSVPRAEFSRVVRETIFSMHGTHVFFTDSSCILPSGWVVRHKAMYCRHPDLGGVGGYIQPPVMQTHDSPLLLPQFFVARSLGITSARYLPKLYEVVNQVFAANPAGDLRAMSYDRQLLDEIPTEATSRAYLEVALKVVAQRHAPIAFIPTSIRCHQAFYTDSKDERARGEALARYRHSISVLGGTQSAVSAVVSEAFHAYRMHGSAVFACAVAWVYVGRAIGALQYWISVLRRVGEARMR